MGVFAALLAPPGARALDQQDFGRRRSRLSSLLGLIVLTVVGVAACGVCWLLGTEQTVRYIPRGSGLPAVMYVHEEILPGPFYIGLALFLIVPGSKLVAIVGPAAFRRWAGWWRRARDRRRWQMPLIASCDGIGDGQSVRVRGQVARGAGFVSTGGRAGAVIAACLGSIGDIADRRQRTRYFWELHGADFRLALAGGQEIQVKIENATLLDRPLAFPAEVLAGRPFASRELPADEPRPASARAVFLHDEQTVGPGEWVEVLGAVRREVDPTAAAGPRGARLQVQLVSTSGRRLLIRAVADAG